MESQSMPEGMEMMMSGMWMLFALAGLAVGIAISIVVILIVRASTNAFRRNTDEWSRDGLAARHSVFRHRLELLCVSQVVGLVQELFRQPGVMDVGDCNRTLALAYCITAVLCIVPCLNYIAGPRRWCCWSSRS